MVRKSWKHAVAASGGVVAIGLLAAGWTGPVSAAERGESAAVQASTNRRSAGDGVYTVEQAERGRETYRRRCVLCHLGSGQGQAAVPEIPGESLEKEGDAAAPPIAGDVFLKKWNGRTARDMFTILAGTMPLGSGGSLSQQEYVDLLAFMFELNKFPAGSQELPAAPDQLALIGIGSTSGN